MKTKLETLQSIVDNHSAAKVKWHDGTKSRTILIDVTSAAIALQIHNACNPENRAKLLAMPWPRMIDVALALASRSRA